ncbi:MAG: response regulator [Nitrospirota bacterium]|nr:response regulator [Nitrospirota bacterium]MDE3243325.1 response regulator [Nitrospirota bacterium]
MMAQELRVARILVIDDEAAIRTMLRDMLESEGHAVVDAPDGAVAMKRWQEQCQDQPFDLIITDILMPEKDGLEVIREVRRLSPGTKVIAISGGSPQVHVRFLDIAGHLGAYRTIDKPFAMHTLLDAVHAALHEPSRHPPAQ